MDTLTQILKNVDGLIVLIGAFIFILGLAGRIKTKWITISLLPAWKKALSMAIGILLISFNSISSPVFKQTDLNIKDTLLNDGGQFQWQFAGQNWAGEVFFKENAKKEIDVEIEINKSFITGQIGEDISILKSPNIIKNMPGTKGKAIIHKNFIEIKNLLVNRSLFEYVDISDSFSIEGNKVKKTVSEIIAGVKLELLPAFAGKITYTNTETGAIAEGNMILVKFNRSVYP